LQFYEKNDEYLPGKKGISMTLDQYKGKKRITCCVHYQMNSIFQSNDTLFHTIPTYKALKELILDGSIDQQIKELTEE
jgi:hypothetical protein